MANNGELFKVKQADGEEMQIPCTRGKFMLIHNLKPAMEALVRLYTRLV